MLVAELFATFGLKPDSSWGKARTLIGGVKALAAGMVVGGAARAISHIVTGATEAATHLISMSTAMGMTIQQTQEWGYVAEQSGSNVKELSVGMNMLLRDLRTYSEGRGSKVLRDRFRELGIGVDDAKNALASPDGLQKMLLKTSDALKGLDDKGLKGMEATFTQLFGVRAGRAMLADLARGSQGLNELFEKRRAMGELTKQQAIDLRDLGNNIKNIKTAFGALAAQVVAAAAPALMKLASAAGKWMEENRDLIQGLVLDAINALAYGFRLLGKAIEFVAQLIRDFHEGSLRARAIVYGLAIAFGIMAAEAVIAWAVAMAPVAAFIATVIGLTAEFLALQDAIGTLPAIALTAASALAVAALVGAGPWVGFLITLTAIVEAIKWISDHWEAITASPLKGVQESLKPGGVLNEAMKTGQGVEFQGFDKGFGLSGTGGLNPATAAVPGPSNGQSVANNNHVNVQGGNTTVNIQTGADAKDVASAIGGTKDDSTDRLMRQTAAALGLA